MNINCQNSAYVGRTHLNIEEQNYKVIQGEIDTINLNLGTLETNYDISSNELSVLGSNYNITSNNLDILSNNYNITSNYIEYNVKPLINIEITPGTILPPVPTLSHTYIYNSNILGEIRFWVRSARDFIIQYPLGVPEYRTKIDVDGKLKLYYTYDFLNNATWGNGWIDPAVLIVGLSAGAVNQGSAITALHGEIVAVDTILTNKIDALVVAINAILAENACLLNTPAQASDLKGLMDVITNAFSIPNGKNAIKSAFENIVQFATTRRIGFLSRAGDNISAFINNNSTIGFIVGAGGVAVGIAYGFIQNGVINNQINVAMAKAIEDNSNLTSNDRRDLYDFAINDVMSSNVISMCQNNFYLNQAQGFITSNVISAQTIPEIYTNKIGLGISPSNSLFPLDVVGNINADYYYKSGVKQFIGTSNDYSNLTLKQGFLNSNVLSPQTIQQLYGSKIGLGISPSNSVFPLDVVGSINGDYYYKSGIRQFMGTSNDYSNLTLSQGFIHPSITTTQTIPKINANNYYRSNVEQFMGTSNDYSNLTRKQGFINSNVLSYQTIPYVSSTEIKIIKEVGDVNLYFIGESLSYGTSLIPDYKIKKHNVYLVIASKDVFTAEKNTICVSTSGAVAIGNYPTEAYKLEVFGTIGATDYYKSGVLLYTGDANSYSNLTQSQGFIHPSILTTQTIPEIYTNKIGVGILPSTSTFPLDVVGNINADYYYRSGVQQFVGTSNQHSNLTLSQGFIHPSITTFQTIPKIYTNNVGIGTTTTTLKLDIINGTLTGTLLNTPIFRVATTTTNAENNSNGNIISYYGNIDNSAGLGICENGIITVGNNANLPLNLQAKGVGAIFLRSVVQGIEDIKLAAGKDFYVGNVKIGDRLFNNNGVPRSLTNFNNSTQFGYNFIAGTTNSPNVNSATQYYSWDIGTGSDYAFGAYRAQFAIPRNVSTPYLCIRYLENSVFQAWQKLSAGYADVADVLTTGNKTITGSLNLAGTSPALTFVGGTSCLGYASAPSVYSSYAFTGDLILRSSASQALILQSGTTNAALVVDIVNNISILNTLNVNILASGNATITNTLNMNGTSPKITFNGTNSLLGYASAPSVYSTTAYTGDLVLRSSTGNALILQSGTANAGLVVDTANNVTVGNTLYVATVNTGTGTLFKRFYYAALLSYSGGVYYTYIDMSGILSVYGYSTSTSIKALKIIIYGVNAGVETGTATYIGHYFLKTNPFEFYAVDTVVDNCNITFTNFNTLLYTSSNSQSIVCVVQPNHY